MDHQLLIFIAILAGLIIIAPYIISWRISRLGSAVTAELPTESVAVLQSWATIKAHGTFVRSSILCKIKLYSDRIGMRLLWSPEKCIKLSSIKSIERLLKGPRTTGLRFKPREAGSFHEMIISGIIDVPKFLEHAKGAGIEVSEVDDSRGMLDMFN